MSDVATKPTMFEQTPTEPKKKNEFFLKFFEKIFKAPLKLE